MGEDISPELIKKTQNSLSKYVKESLLNEKFLKKPPFRYLQDVIKNVIKDTGFLKDVFTPEELVDYGKDKERKIAFLKKLISAVQDATGDQIVAKPSKIIAGLEVPKTLELLQQVGKAVSLKETSVKKPVKTEDAKDKKSFSMTKEPVKKTKKLEPTKSEENLKVKKKIRPESKESDREKKKKPERDSAKENKKLDDRKKRRPSVESVERKEKEPLLSKQNSVQDENKEITRRSSVHKLKSSKETEEDSPKVRDTEDEPLPSATRAKSGELNTDPDKPTPDETLKKDVKEENVSKPKTESPSKNEEDPTTKPKERRPSSRRASSKIRTEKSDKTDKKEEGSDHPATVSKIDRPKTGKKSAKEPEVPLLGAIDSPVGVAKIERPKTARKAPPSSKPGAPKARDRGEVKQDLNAISSEPDAKPVPVIVEMDNKDDDKDNLVVLEAQPLNLENDVQNGILMPEDDNLGENEGALVAQILETKKELDENKQLWSSNVNKVEIEWEGGKKQKREAVIKEVNKMKEGIQQLTRATNPLGKLFDFLQEDVDSMQRELRLWTETNSNYSKQFKQEHKLSESSLETYKRQLAELDSLIEQEQEAVRNLKANILSNDKKIINIVTRIP